ncbi:MAG: hypothetical protein ACFFED_09090 [Candidatus Thorarchaeota archaeon]
MTSRITASRKVVAGISVLLVCSSIIAAVWLMPMFENDSEIQCLSVGCSYMVSGLIQIDAVFSPFSDDLKLVAVECDPVIENLEAISNVTGNNALEEWFNGYMLLDIHGNFESGTGYQFTLRFLDGYMKRKVVHVYVPFSLESESLVVDTTKNISHEIAQEPESIGNQVVFWTPSLEGSIQTLGTLLAVGSTCYVYMANSSIELLGEENAFSKCEELQIAFDEIIYPKGVEVAGHPDGTLGDIDSDPRVTVYLCPLVRTMGQAYLGTHEIRNELPGSRSNQREMVYVDSEKDMNETICLTIHEFNHLIWDNNEFDEADFLTEGLANYAIDYAGYWYYITDAVTTSYTLRPQVSLLHFNRFYSRFWDASYGQAYLFVTYLAERFGVDFVKGLVALEEDAAYAVEKALADANQSLSFNDVYLDWITACVLDNPDIEDGRYGFETQDYTIQTHTTYFGDWPVEREDVRHNLYGMHVKKIYSPESNFTFEIENPWPNAMGIVIAIRDVEGWTVKQSIHYSIAGSFSEYVEGSNIEEVYIITSVISPNTPTEYYDVFSEDEIPNVLLDYSFSEGLIPNYSQLPFFITILGLPAIIVIATVVIVKYRRIQCQVSTNSMTYSRRWYARTLASDDSNRGMC